MKKRKTIEIPYYYGVLGSRTGIVILFLSAIAFRDIEWPLNLVFFIIANCLVYLASKCDEAEGEEL